MRSTFFGLNIGYKALQAQQRALDVTSHNIANANTQGYTRQDVIMSASKPIKVLQGYVGTGVDIVEFRRIRDGFLDNQIRTENKALGEWEVRSDILSKLEVVFNEPSEEAGLRSVMDQYWEAWQQLTKNPESSAVRANVVQRGITLVDTFNHMDRLFHELQVDINKSISIRVDEVNSIGRQVRDLNEQIIKAEAAGQKANDLRDKRDLLMEQLSKIVDVDVVEDEFGAVNVSVGGYTLVSRGYLAELRFTDDDINPTNAKLEWVDPMSGNVLGPARVKSGMLKGFIDMRDEVIGGSNGYISKIGELAAGIAQEVNNLHRQGRDLNGDLGEDFFVTKDPLNPTFSAGNIAVNQNIVNDTNKIAASKNNLPDPVIEGDNTNALAIAQLKNKKTMNGGVASFDDFYRSAVGKLGVQSQEAERMVNNQSLLVDQLQNKREGISGVSLDEEMTNMIKFQHAYSAAARIINTMDEMLEVIVNRLGMVGR